MAQTDTPADNLFKDAEALFQKGDFSKSASTFERFFFQHQNDPRRHEALYRQGLCEMKGGRARKAIEIWNKLFTMDKNSGKWSEASLSALEQLVNYYGSNQEYQLQSRMLDQMLLNFSDSPVTVRTCIRVATLLYRKGDYKESVALYERVSKHLVARDIQNFNTAKAMVAIDTLTPEEIITTAEKNLESGNEDAAIALYEHFLGKYPNLPQQWEAKTQLGWCYYRKAGSVTKNRDTYKRAEKLWEETVKNAPPGDWAASSRWKLVLLNAAEYENPKKAISLCEEQFREYRDSWRGRQAKLVQAWLYLIAENYAEAHTHFLELAEVYNEHDNPRIQEYLQSCEEGMRGGL
ncbi:MAG: tetratricopeptide repeat protein [Lentisphaerae bacterium]|nr:tetratricopeptide repeat protein [Lentisphaerota bacterium]